MTVVVIAVLVVLIGYLAMRLFSAASEISALRAHVTSLKRRLQEER